MLSALVGLWLIAQAGGAQLTVTIPPDTPFQIAWDHDGKLTPGFRWWCDGAIIRNFGTQDAVPAPTPNADGTFTYVATSPGLPVGTHSCQVSAYNRSDPQQATTPSAATEPHSAAICLAVGAVGCGVPAAPVRLQIVIKVGGA